MNLVVIVDTSASVAPYAKLYHQTVSEIVNYQKSVNPESLFSCMTFNEHTKYHHVNNIIRYVEKPFDIQDLQTRYNTALYDQIAAILNRLRHFYLETKRYISPSVAIIFTDGEDNKSTHITKVQLALQIAMMRNLGWRFIFLGTSEEAVKIGKELGCRVCILYNQTEQSFQNMYKVVTDVLSKNVAFLQDFDVRDLDKQMEAMSLN